MINIQIISKMLLALFIGVCGSIFFIYLNLPLPWLLGAIFSTSIAIKFEKLPIQNPKFFSPSARILIGLTIGSAFSPEILDYIDVYFFSLLLVFPFTILIIISGTFYYHRILNYDIKTSYLGSMPGGVIEMAILGEEIKANISKITLMQSSRLFFIVISLPFIIQYIFQIDISGNKLITIPLKNTNLLELSILIILGYITAMVAKKLKLTAAYLMGPMIISIIVFSIGIIHTTIPDEFLKFIQVVFGTMIGFTFKGVSFESISKTLFSTLGHFIILITLCGIFILITYYLFDFPMLSILLAYGPGGQSEINLIAILVGANIPYITLHHIVRLFIVINLAPIIAKKLDRNKNT